MFERLLKGMSRLAALGELFFGQNFFPLQLSDAFLIGRNHRVAACIHDPIKELIDLLLELLDIRLEAFGSLRRLRKAHVPGIAEHRLHEREQAFSRL